MRAIISERSWRCNHLRAIDGHALVTLNTHNFAGVPGSVLAMARHPERTW